MLRRPGVTIAFAMCWCIAAASPVLAVTAAICPFFSDVGFFGFVAGWAVFWILGFTGLCALGAAKQVRAAREADAQVGGMGDLRLDRGIWRTAHGVRLPDCAARRRSTGSQALPPTWTALEALREWRDEHRRLAGQVHPASRRGTLASDVEAYLAAVRAMPSYADRVREIAAWLLAFGDRPRWLLHSDDVRRQLHAWRQAGLAASTVNHRRTALSHLFTVLDGKGARNPVRDVPPFPEPPPIRRGLPLYTVLRVIDALTFPKTQARLRVLVWTGMRPSELMRLTPESVDLAAGLCYVPTSKGGPPREVALNRRAIRAVRQFMAVGTWGRFSGGDDAEVARGDVPAARDAALPGLRPAAHLRARAAPARGRLGGYCRPARPRVRRGSRGATPRRISAKLRAATARNPGGPPAPRGGESFQSRVSSPGGVRVSDW